MQAVFGFYLLFSLLFGSNSMEATSTKTSKIEQDKEIARSYSRYPSYGQSGAGKAFSKPFIEAAKKSRPAVVFIRAEGGTNYAQPDPYDFFNDDFFNRFFGGPPQRRQRSPQISQGSGFIISPDGYILTNFHVVRGAKTITVHLQNGVKRKVSATLIGGDSHTDIAVIKINESNGMHFPYLDFANSDDVEVGEWVIAVGNPFQLESTVTAGIISAKGRQNLQITDYEDFIQTDAAINPGNSGGPLVDLDGNVIGMNTAIVSQTGGYMGIGFAIPSNVLSNIKQQIIDKGTVTRGFLGVSLQPIDSDLAEAFGLNQAQGALVVDVVEGSPADKAGLKQGDIITKLNGNLVKNPSSLRNDVVLLPPDTQVNLTINRNGQILHIPVTLGTHGQNTMVSSATASRHLGISVDNLTPENIQKYKLGEDDEGLVIVDVDPTSPAGRSGLQPGFLVIAVNHQKVTNVNEFNDALNDVKPGQRVLILVRQGSLMRFYSLKAEG